MLTKYGSARIVKLASYTSELGQHLGLSQQTMARLAQAGVLELDPDRYLYLRARLVSALEKHGPNDNGDAFEESELKKRYATFVNSGVYLDHDNGSEDKAVGWIADAWYDPRGWVEGVLVVDKNLVEQVRPGLIAKVLDTNNPQHLTDGSMGCYVQYSICSRCGNIATTPDEYCECIKTSKGREGIYEINRGVTFFEWSLLDPAGSEGGIGADQDAKILEKFGSRRTSPLSQLVVRRQASGCGACVKRCDQGRFPTMNSATLLKEASSMANQAPSKTAALPGGAEAPAENDKKGNPTETMQDKGDYGSAAGLNKEMKSQTSGTGGGSTAETSKGNPSATQQDAGDYQLTAARQAHAAGAAVTAAILKMAEPAAELGGTPKKVEENKEKMDDAREDAADSKNGSFSQTNSKKTAEAESPEAAVGTQRGGPESEDLAKQDTRSDTGEYSKTNGGEPEYKLSASREAEVVAAAAQSGFKAMLGRTLGSLFKKADAAGPIGGGNAQRAMDAGNYNEPKQKDDAFKSQSDAWARETQTQRTQQQATGLSTPQERQDQQSIAASKTASNDAQKLDFVVKRMAQGVPYEKAEAEARQQFAALEKKAEGTAADISGGNLATKFGPETTPVADQENRKQEGDLRSETQGATVPAEIRDNTVTDVRAAAAKVKQAQSMDQVFEVGEGPDAAGPGPADSASDSQSKSAGFPSPGAMQAQPAAAPGAPPPMAAEPVAEEIPEVPDMGDSQSPSESDSKEGQMGAAPPIPPPAMPMASGVSYGSADSASGIVKDMESKADSIAEETEKKKEEAALHAQAGDGERARQAVRAVELLNLEQAKLMRASALLRTKIAAYNRAPGANLKKTIAASIMADVAIIKQALKKANPLVPSGKGAPQKSKDRQLGASSREASLAAENAALKAENDQLKATFRQATASFKGELKTVALRSVAQMQERLGIDAHLTMPERVHRLASYSREQLDAMAETLAAVAEKVPGAKAGGINTFTHIPPRMGSLNPNAVKDEMDGMFDDPRMSK